MDKPDSKKLKVKNMKKVLKIISSLNEKTHSCIPKIVDLFDDISNENMGEKFILNTLDRKENRTIFIVNSGKMGLGIDNNKNHC